MMKYISLIISIVAIAFSAFSLISANVDRDIIVSTEGSAQQRTISVRGYAERAVAPDTASVSFEMTRKSLNVSDATNSVNTRIADLIKSLSDDDVKKSDIKTLRYNVSPEYTWNDGDRRFDGYRVSQQLEVTMTDLDRVDGILSKIALLNVDNVSQLKFFIKDDDAVRKELRAEAIADAQDEAKDLARQLGVSLEGVVSYTEGSVARNNPQPAYRAFAVEDASFSVDAIIPSGENDLTSQVTIIYKIQ